MDIILTQDFPSLGYVGDLVKVRRGYARNFLIPRGMGVEASIRNQKLLKHLVSGITSKRVKLRGEAEELKVKIELLKPEFMLKLGEKGKTFGSVTPKEIEASLQVSGFKIDRRQIKIAEPIRRVGEYKVHIKLHAEVVALITVKVNSDVPPTAATEAKSANKASKREGKAGAARKSKAKAESEETAVTETETEAVS